MKLKRKKKLFAIPLNSMSDVAFLLLIFIMLVALINYRVEVSIDFPEAESAGRTDADHNLEIWIDRAGDFYIDGVRSDLAGIQNIIIETYQSAPDTRIHIIADRNTPFEGVNKVLQMLQILQYRVVSFVVRESGTN